MKLLPGGHFGNAQNVTTAELIEAVDLKDPSDVVGQEKPMLTLPETGEIISEFDQGVTEFVQDVTKPLSFETAFTEEGTIIALEDHVQKVVEKRQKIERWIFGASILVLGSAILEGRK